MGLFEPHGRGRRPLRPDALNVKDGPTDATPSPSPRLPGKGRGEGQPPDAVVVVHTLAHAVGALQAAARFDQPLILASAPNAGIYAGPGWFGALVTAAREAVPRARFSALLDCGDRPGAVLAAIRAQTEAVIFTGGSDVAGRLADIASQHGVRLVIERPAAGFDLGEDFFASEATSARRCADFLAAPDA
jgi:hypothetical protein